MKYGSGLLMGSLVVVALVLGMVAPVRQVSLAAGATLYVDIDATGINNGTSWVDAFTDLQAALDAAASGDQIWVAEGTYTPTAGSATGDPRFFTFQLESGVALYGGFDALVGDIGWGDRDWANNVTILSGDLGVAGDNSDNCYHVFYHPIGTNLGGSAILDGFTIRDGNANGSAPHNSGGGMYNGESSPTLANLTFSGNSAIYGGGMYNNASNPTLTNITYSDNSADLGGGMYDEDSSPTLVNVTFNLNMADFGGGMYNDTCSPTLTNVTFSTNAATSDGGGIYNYFSNPTLTGVTFTRNFALANGGGMLDFHSDSLLLNRAVFNGNSAKMGGGIYNDESNDLILTNISFTGNVAEEGGGGMLNYRSSLTLTNVTLSSNQAYLPGGAILNQISPTTLTNAIAWGNTPDQISGGLFINYSDIQDGCPDEAVCTHMINLDPQFMRSPSPGADGKWYTNDDDYGDLRLQLTSPAIDAGDTSIVPPGITTDLLGFPRFVDILSVLDTGFGTPPLVDMGAYEAQAVVVYLPVVTK